VIRGVASIWKESDVMKWLGPEGLLPDGAIPSPALVRSYALGWLLVTYCMVFTLATIVDDLAYLLLGWSRFGSTYILAGGMTTLLFIHARHRLRNDAGRST
jgi:hypothetical protein